MLLTLQRSLVNVSCIVIPIVLSLSGCYGRSAVSLSYIYRCIFKKSDYLYYVQATYYITTVKVSNIMIIMILV